MSNEERMNNDTIIFWERLEQFNELSGSKVLALRDIAYLMDCSLSRVANWEFRYDDFPDGSCILDLGTPRYNKQEIVSWLVGKGIVKESE